MTPRGRRQRKYPGWIGYVGCKCGAVYCKPDMAGCVFVCGCGTRTKIEYYTNARRLWGLRDGIAEAMGKAGLVLNTGER